MRRKMYKCIHIQKENNIKTLAESIKKNLKKEIKTQKNKRNTYTVRKQWLNRAQIKRRRTKIKYVPTNTETETQNQAAQGKRFPATRRHTIRLLILKISPNFKL